MKQFLYSNYILKEERQNKKLPFLEVAKEVTNKILAIWCKASLPTVSEKQAMKMLADYHHKYLKKSECGLPNDHFGRLTSVTLVLIIKNKLGSAQVPKFGRLLVKMDSSASIP